MLPDPNHLLTQLESAKNRFDQGHAARVEKLLAQLVKLQLNDPHQLIRFHECLLFLRAFPHAASQVAQVERLLSTFHERIEKLIAAKADMSLFDDFDTSGMAGTTMQDTLSFDVAQWLTQRIPRNVDIAWHDYWDDDQSERARGSTWPRFIPLLEEDADVEANIPWSSWLQTATGSAGLVIPNRAESPVRNPLSSPLPWLLKQFAQLPLPEHQRAELYDSLRLPIRWKLENLKLTRTRNWTRPRRFFFHKPDRVAPDAFVRDARKERRGVDEACPELVEQGVRGYVSRGLIQRHEVSLDDELAQPAPKFEKLPPAAGESVMHAIREIMVVRYRELYGTTLGDQHSVVRADLGRGVVMHFWGIPSSRRLPIRAYLAGYTLKNGVPINYIEAIGLCEWIEVGFNTFYTYRQGETAWIYAQALRCLRALTKANCISIYPYQIGQNNDEAIDSGAFWFYRKLGFRPGRPDLQKLCEREEKRIAANPQYRTPPRTLRRLAEAHMFYDVSVRARPEAEVRPGRARLSVVPLRAIDDVGRGKPPFAREELPIARATVEERPIQGRVTRTLKETDFSPRSSEPGPWDTFSIRNIGLAINRRMARDFDGDSQKIRQASVARITRALKLNPLRWSYAERHALENWSLVLALIPDLARWSPAEKSQLAKIIRAKSAPNEMPYLRHTQHHPRLRAELLRLGSWAPQPR